MRSPSCKLVPQIRCLGGVRPRPQKFRYKGVFKVPAAPRLLEQDVWAPWVDARVRTESLVWARQCLVGVPLSGPSGPQLGGRRPVMWDPPGGTAVWLKATCEGIKTAQSGIWDVSWPGCGMEHGVS